MPTIVIAHTFCASGDTQISYRRCVLIQGFFCGVQNYAEKAELSKFSWYPKRKLGVTMHFPEITRPSVRVHWVACGTCSVKGKFFQVGGSLRPFIIWLVFVADITRALIG